MTPTQPSTTLLIVKAKTTKSKIANKLASSSKSIENPNITKAKIAQTIQKSINTGIVWRLEGSAGRQAMACIEDGLCILGVEDSRDYYGNHIPSRSQVVEGSKGSISYAENLQGKAHVACLLAVDNVTEKEATVSILKGFAGVA